MIDLHALHSVADISRHQAQVNGDRIALVFEGRETTYRELDERTSRVANGLVAEGCKEGTRIGYLGKNSDYYFEVMLGAAKAKAVIAAVNWRLAAAE